MPAVWDEPLRAPLPPGPDRQPFVFKAVTSGMRGGYSYEITGGAPPPRPAGSESLAPAPAPVPKASHRSSTWRPASSIYSQPSPRDAIFPDTTANLASSQAHRNGYGMAAHAISPPSSPEPEYTHGARFLARQGPSPDVSANGNSREHTTSSPAGRTVKTASNSSIPMMRRAKREQDSLAMRQARSRDQVDDTPSESPVGPPAESDPFGDKPLIKRKSTPSQAKAQPRPPSRFGVSAYATDATDTPRQSSDEHPPSMPTPPSPPTRLVNRLGMKVNHEDPSVSFPFAPQTARDRRAALDGPLGNTAVNRARMPVERPTSSASSINKMLPPAPPEISADQAQDRVAMLNAQLSALGNRRINLTRSIKQMTELMPMDNLMASREVLLKRDMEKRKVAALKNELAEVQREEYDLGLKLHRAYKRMDRDAVWEPTTLWVRRVAGP
ncbi:hypothetical protein P8C59_005583 [Phyllachora maydis]|uniref:Uncharacterized protein n=1 Tax=Phyllachora maydis TaxID=1825666 RepID=A0AAD9I4K5_9PEZI|nr:hypothetical protein P8C59_005583 [Phyllachora maydis]